MQFKDLNLITQIQEAIKEQGYSKPTPIQEKAIPSILAGRDFLGCAKTGTGKTAAFAIPILQKLSKSKRVSGKIRALVLAPTRELAVQIGESFENYGKHLDFKTIVVYGGVAQEQQIDAIDFGADILVATPGRLIDLLNQGQVKLQFIDTLVLDEADRMLDMAMLFDVQKIISELPTKRQNMLFSATIPPGINQLVNNILSNPVKLEIKSDSSKGTKEAVYFVDEVDKISLLIHLLKNKAITSAIVFARTKERADKITNVLAQERISVEALHGDKSQRVRETTLNSFKNKEIRVLVATDVAARGIDIENLSHVINFDLPNLPETYVHRIGRTGRAGAAGIALSFCNGQEKKYLTEIEKLIGESLQIVKDHPYCEIDVLNSWLKAAAKKAPKPVVNKEKPTITNSKQKLSGKDKNTSTGRTGKTSRSKFEAKDRDKSRGRTGKTEGVSKTTRGATSMNGEKKTINRKTPQKAHKW